MWIYACGLVMYICDGAGFKNINHVLEVSHPKRDP
jgi:hypothetical protein